MNIARLLKKSNDESAERYRKATLTSIMNVLSQGVQLATGLISVPLTLDYVGTERFGIWMTLSTALTFITFSDFGIGIGVQDKMSRFVGSEQFDRARRSFLTSFIFVSFLFFVLDSAGELWVPKIDLAKLLALKSKGAIDEIVPITQMVIFVLGLGLLSGIVQRAFNALQEGFLVAVIQVVARICSLILLFVVVELQLGLPVLIFIVGGLASVGLIILGLPILFYRHRWMIPKGRFMDEFIDLDSLLEVLKIGVLGLGASIAIYFVNNSIPILIARQYGAESVTEYAILLKLISIPSILLTFLLLPLWPAITEAKQKNDMDWIKKTYKKCTLFTIGLATISGAVFLYIGQDIILLWTHNEKVVPSSGLLVACIVFVTIGYWNTLTSVILNGMSKYKGQATYGVFLALLFVYVATLIPSAWEKEMIIWAIAAGYFIRCAIMQIEVFFCLRAKVQK